MVVSTKSDLSLWTNTPSHVLVARADELRAERRWKTALKVLAVAEANADDETTRRAVLERLAVTAADAGAHRISSNAVFELHRAGPVSGPTWLAFSRVALARANYEHADSAARSVLAENPTDPDAWTSLATSYAGLGWFDEAKQCLSRLGSGELGTTDRWRLGRAVNHWATARNRALMVGLIGAILVGWLGIALAVGWQIVVRRRRLSRLPPADGVVDLRGLADEAWADEKRLRLVQAAAIAASVAAFVVSVL